MDKNVLVFDISAQLAHFRKIYTNSSSLTYLIPPKVTIMGLIAAILGLEKDSYYRHEAFLDMNIGVSILNKHRTITHWVNYLFIENYQDVCQGNKGNHTQVPIEYVTSNDSVKYRIFLSCENGTFAKIKTALVNEQYAYGPCLGPAYCLADIEYIGEYTAKQVENTDNVSVQSVLRKDDICKLDFSPNLYREKIPYEFNENRIAKTTDYIFSKDGNAIVASFKKGTVYKIDIEEHNQTLFTFM